MKLFARWEYRRLIPEGIGNAKFRITGIGIGECYRRGLVRRPGGTSDCLLIFFPPSGHSGERGKGILYLPGMPQMYGEAEGVWEHNWLMCGGPAAGALLQRYASRSGIFHPFSREEQVLSLFRMIRAEMELPSPDSDILQNFFEILLLELFREGKTPASSIPERLQRVLPLLESFEQEIALEHLARKAGLSVSRFCEDFKQNFACSPIQYRQRLLLNEACYLLRNDSLNIAEIAGQLKFSNQFYFSNWFRRKTGHSPTDYRKMTGIPSN